MWKIFECSSCGAIFSLPVELIDKKGIFMVNCPLCTGAQHASDHFIGTMWADCRVTERSEWNIELP